MTSGQPFGYRADAPNQKPELKERLEKWKEWREKFGNATPRDAFKKVDGSWLIDAACAVPLAEVFELRKACPDACIATFSAREKALSERVTNFIPALTQALQSKVFLQEISDKIFAYQDEFIRFFTRLGQGGTR
ncbi:MAG: hypothetical protein M3Q32_05975, partial [Pseudomonadota bacterium]|nr:hypothetical protein [Pseudomonadota bacterium]